MSACRLHPARGRMGLMINGLADQFDPVVVVVVVAAAAAVLLSVAVAMIISAGRSIDFGPNLSAASSAHLVRSVGALGAGLAVGSLLGSGANISHGPAITMGLCELFPSAGKGTSCSFVNI